MSLTVSAAGPLLYNSPDTLTQFTWFDRAGKPLERLGEPEPAFQAVHPSPGARREKTLEELGTANTERILHALVGPAE
jgi:hypothetical protein